MIMRIDALRRYREPKPADRDGAFVFVVRRPRRTDPHVLPIMRWRECLHA